MVCPYWQYQIRQFLKILSLKRLKCGWKILSSEKVSVPRLRSVITSTGTQHIYIAKDRRRNGNRPSGWFFRPLTGGDQVPRALRRSFPSAVRAPTTTHTERIGCTFTLVDYTDNYVGWRERTGHCRLSLVIKMPRISQGSISTRLRWRGRDN